MNITEIVNNMTTSELFCLGTVIGMFISIIMTFTILGLQSKYFDK